MPERSNADRLELAVARLLESRASRPPAHEDDATIGPLLALANDLRFLPRPAFRASLHRQLERVATIMASTETAHETAVTQTATPLLRVKNAPAAIGFYTKAFGARELMRFTGGGRIAHAELAIGNSRVTLSEEAPEWGFPGPEALGGSPITMHLQVEDADAMVTQAVAAGARLVSPLANQFYGQRSGQLADPFGHRWTVSTRIEDLSLDEMHRRFQAMEAEQQSARTAPSFIPKGFRAVTPYVVVQNAPEVIEFATRVFGAQERHRAIGPAGGVHAELQIGDSILMVGGGGAPESSWRGRTLPTALHVYVEDVDAAFARALQGGATVLGKPTDHE